MYMEKEMGAKRVEPRKVSWALLPKRSFVTLHGNKSLDGEQKPRVNVKNR